MLTIAKLFGKSPFSHLQNHMHKVAACIKQLEVLFACIFEDQTSKIQEHVKTISKLEHEADLCKNDIRNHLPKSIFLPIDRSHFLMILSLQDSLADKAEDIANVFAIGSQSFFPKESEKPLKNYIEKNVEAFWQARSIIKEIKELIESSFGGKEAEKVKEMIDKTSFLEHESDCLKRQLLTSLFANAENLSYPNFYLSIKLIEEIGEISHIAEKLATQIRLILET